MGNNYASQAHQLHAKGKYCRSSSGREGFFNELSFFTGD
jgi:hypothetical protein